MSEKPKGIEGSILDLIDLSGPFFTSGLRALAPSCDGYERERDILSGKAACAEEKFDNNNNISEYDAVRSALLGEVGSTNEEKRKDLESSLDLLRGVSKEMLSTCTIVFHFLITKKPAS
jgi:hypothetical protein